MSPFTCTASQLSEAFSNRGIPFDLPGFCDHPSFVAIERLDADFLNHYAAWVAKRQYEPSYLSKARTIIDRTTSVLYKALKDNGRLGACVDMSGILFRTLEEQGIWSCCIKGSMTATFPPQSGIGPRYFWSADHGSFVAGHAWLVAPPYQIIDLTLSQQPYEGQEKQYIPDTVMTTNASPDVVTLDDIVSPSKRAEMLALGIPYKDQLKASATLIPEIHASFPVLTVPGLDSSRLKYSPVAIGIPEEKLIAMRNMTFRGMTPWEFYRNHIAS